MSDITGYYNAAFSLVCIGDPVVYHCCKLTIRQAEDTLSYTCTDLHTHKFNIPFPHTHTLTSFALSHPPATAQTPTPTPATTVATVSPTTVASASASASPSPSPDVPLFPESDYNVTTDGKFNGTICIRMVGNLTVTVEYPRAVSC